MGIVLHARQSPTPQTNVQPLAVVAVQRQAGLKRAVTFTDIGYLTYDSEGLLKVTVSLLADWPIFDLMDDMHQCKMHCNLFTLQVILAEDRYLAS